MTQAIAQSLLNKHNIKVYPEGELINDSLYHFYIYVNSRRINKMIVVKPRQKDSKKRVIGFDKLNDALTKTIMFEANKLVK